MNERSQRPDDLLDLYLDALAHDASASPPPGLDEATAAFARRLMRAERRGTPTMVVRDRMWKAALTTAQTSTNTHRPTAEKENPMQLVMTPERRESSMLLMVAVISAVILFAGLLIGYGGGALPPSEPQQGGQLPALAGAEDDEAQRGDTSPTPPPTMTATPIPFDPGVLPALEATMVPPTILGVDDIEPSMPFPLGRILSLSGLLDSQAVLPTYVIAIRQPGLLMAQLQFQSEAGAEAELLFKTRFAEDPAGEWQRVEAEVLPAGWHMIEVEADQIVALHINRKADSVGMFTLNLQLNPLDPALAVGEPIGFVIGSSLDGLRAAPQPDGASSAGRPTVVPPTEPPPSPLDVTATPFPSVNTPLDPTAVLPTATQIP